jgi:pyrophosphatase PpaX
MRFPVVLFDLDGTLVDSGAIILASMRHATKTVLSRDIPDAELMAAVGGPRLEEQMRVFSPERVEELVRVYREHNEPLHDVLESCTGMEAVVLELSRQGRRLGVVSAKRRATVALAFAQVPLGHLFEVIVGGDDTERQKPDPAPLLFALDRLGARPEDAAYVGDSPYDMQSAKAAGLFAVGVSWGGIHRREALVEYADAIVDSPEELLAVL